MEKLIAIFLVALLLLGCIQTGEVVKEQNKTKEVTKNVSINETNQTIEQNTSVNNESNETEIEGNESESVNESNTTNQTEEVEYWVNRLESPLKVKLNGIEVVLKSVEESGTKSRITLVFKNIGTEFDVIEFDKGNVKIDDVSYELNISNHVLLNGSSEEVKLVKEGKVNNVFVSIEFFGGEPPYRTLVRMNTTFKP